MNSSSELSKEKTESNKIESKDIFKNLKKKYQKTIYRKINKGIKIEYDESKGILDMETKEIILPLEKIVDVDEEGESIEDDDNENDDDDEKKEENIEKVEEIKNDFNNKKDDNIDNIINENELKENIEDNKINNEEELYEIDTSKKE